MSKLEACSDPHMVSVEPILSAFDVVAVELNLHCHHLSRPAGCIGRAGTGGAAPINESKKPRALIYTEMMNGGRQQVDMAEHAWEK